VISDHIHHLFVQGIEEGDRIDYKESGCLSSGADIRELLKDFAAMANASGGIIIIGIRESNGRPIQPIKAGLQSVRNVDQQSNRLHQLISTHFGEVAPKVETTSLEVVNKRLLLVKAFKGVEPLGGKKKPAGDLNTPYEAGELQFGTAQSRKRTDYPSAAPFTPTTLWEKHPEL
jgi:predicted HTH transcriptional regulator